MSLVLGTRRCAGAASSSGDECLLKLVGAVGNALDVGGECFDGICAEVAKFLTDDQLGVYFEGGTDRIAEELIELSFRIASGSFCDVGGDGDGSATQLAPQSVDLFFRKCRGKDMHVLREYDGILPDLEVLEPVHFWYLVLGLWS